MVCDERANGERSLVPVPFDVKVNVATPDFGPAVEVFTPTRRAVLYPCGARAEKEPEAVASPVAPPAAASSFSLKPSFAAVFVMKKGAESTSPTRTLPKKDVPPLYDVSG